MSTASAPASIANLGPGFDLLALAVTLRLEVEVVPSDRWRITSDGRPVSDATAALVHGVAGDDPLDVFIRSRIPVGKGLGSSAALRVAVRAAVQAQHGDVERDDLFAGAAIAEGHPDNVAAAVYGGLTAVTVNGGILRLGVHPSLRVLVGVPSTPLATEEARRILHDTVPRSVAVRTAARVTALVEGLRTADPAAFDAASGDEIHEGPRMDLSPLTTALVASAREAGALHAAWSGAGPAAVALVVDATAGHVAEALSTALDGDGEVLRLEIDRAGLEIA